MNSTGSREAKARVALDKAEKNIIEKPEKKPKKKQTEREINLIKIEQNVKI